MIFKRKELVVAIALMGISSASFAAEEDNKKSAQLERVEIVGSNIKRIQKEGPVPVTVIKRDEIEKTGATTVSELLRNMAANSGSSFDDSFSSGFAPGSSGVSLRGLGMDATLVLLNGRRVANYGYAQNVGTSFVDLNSMPTGAIERVEILRDGASAIYGSDAVAGVINIITRKNYKGIETKITAGKSSRNDGNEVATNLTMGFGNLDENRYNVLVSIDTFDRAPIFARDRKISQSANKIPQGGEDLRSPTSSPGTYEDAAGNMVPMAGCKPEDILNDGTDKYCAYDYNKVLTLAPETHRRGVMSVFNYKVTDDITLFAEAGLNRNTSESISAPTPTSGFAPATAAGNPTGQKTFFMWRMLDAGNRESTVTSDASRLLAGLRGSVGEWDWEFAAGNSKNKAQTNGRNFINKTLFNAALANGTLSPFIKNPQSVIDSLKANTVRKSESTLRFNDFKVSNSELFNLPAGPVGVAMGLDYRKESVNDVPDPLSAQKLIIGSGGTAAKGERSVKAGYVEFNVPVTKQLELQLAARRDVYNDFGGSTNPKVAFRWQPDNRLLVRGSYSTAFRAPSLSQAYLGESVGFVNLVDTARCEKDSSQCGRKQYMVIKGGNPKLDPETSKNFSFGLVVEPVKWLSASFDIYRIEKVNSIDDNPQYVLDNYTKYAALIDRKQQTAAEIAAGLPGKINSVSAPFLNLGQVIVNGADLEVSAKMNLAGWGEFGLKNSLTYMKDYLEAEYPGADINQRAGGVNYPKFRNNMLLTLDKGQWSHSLVYRYFGRTKDSGTPYGGKRWVASDNVFDIQTVYSFSKKGTKLTVGVKNLFDKAPPFSTANAPSEGYQIQSYNARGRYFYTTLQHQFM